MCNDKDLPQAPGGAPNVMQGPLKPALTHCSTKTRPSCKVTLRSGSGSVWRLSSWSKTNVGTFGSVNLATEGLSRIESSKVGTKLGSISVSLERTPGAVAERIVTNVVSFMFALGKLLVPCEMGEGCELQIWWNVGANQPLYTKSLLCWKTVWLQLEVRGNNW